MAIITTALNSAALIVTLQKIIYEWLVDFLTSTEVSRIYAYIVQNTDDISVDLPWCEYIIRIPSTGPTGAGAKGTEARFEHVECEIAFRAKRPGNEYDLTVLGDLLGARFRHATKGRPILGAAGLRKAVLTGPIPDNDQKFYLQRWFLTFRVEAANA